MLKSMMNRAVLLRDSSMGMIARHSRGEILARDALRAPAT
jgi:hypothetical protein